MPPHGAASRTTPVLVSSAKWTSSTPSRMSRTTRSPLRWPAGRSTWVTSPVTTIREPKPSRLYRRYRTLIRNGKLKTVAIVAIARELAGFIWAVARAVTTARVAAAPA